MSKWTVGILGVVGLCVAVLIAFIAFVFIHGIKLPADLATRPWIEHKFLTDRLALDVPWELKPVSPSGKVSSDCRMDNCQRSGLEVITSVSAVSPGGNLDVTMDRMTELLKAKPGVTVLWENRREELVLGGRAIALYQAVGDRWTRKTNIRILFFKFEDRLYQVHCNSRTGDPTGDAVWERMRKSIRFLRTATKPADGAFALPAGMKRR